MFRAAHRQRAATPADFYNPATGPNVSHIHYGTKGNWFIRSGASDGNVNIQDGPTGNVGIGTNIPVAKLHVEGGTYLGGPSLTNGGASGGAVRVFNNDGSGTSFPTLQLDANQIQAINRGLTLPAFGYARFAETESVWW